MNGRSKKVKVWVRIRPTANLALDMLDLQDDGKSVNVHCKRDSRRGVVNNQILDWSFKLDGILHNASQEHLYSTVAADIVSSALDGFNGTLMCYGQTGAGKTFTMTGATENYKQRGVIPRGLSQLYKDIEERPEQSVTVRLSYLEIYNETMFDLLSTLPETMNAAQQSPMTVVEDEHGVYVKGLSCHLANTEEEALNFLFEGETNRAIATHTLNKHSSRSHCIFTVYIESRSRVTSEAKYTISKLNFVDLAGSERLGKTQSVGKTKEEAMYINKSLSFLEQTVIALADKRREHVPFRQTKLTHCLKDSIGGNCNTLLVANIWGEADQIEETISTLRFAIRMMCINSEPAANQHYDPNIMVKKLEKEIVSLKRELAMHDTLTNRSQITYDPLSEQQRYEIKQQVRQYMEGTMDQVDIVNIRQIQGAYEAFREICGQMEAEVEERFRAKYTLVDKTDPAAIAAAQAAGIPIGDDGELVGEPDGSGFGVGQAPASTKPAASSVVNAKKKDRTRGKSKDRSSLPEKDFNSPDKANASKLRPIGVIPTFGDRQDVRNAYITSNPVPTPQVYYCPVAEGQPLVNHAMSKAMNNLSHVKSSDNKTSLMPQRLACSVKVTSGRISPAPKATSPSQSAKDKHDGSMSQTPSGDKKDREDGAGTPSSTSDSRKEMAPPPRPSTPPSRPEAFEEFKQNMGSEINKILLENKDILGAKKKAYADLAKQLNCAKMEIDNSRKKLEMLRDEREAQGPMINDEGDVIISEDEFLEIKRLKDLKAIYRTDFEELKSLKTEVQYCQKLVDQCRQKLIQEFDNWYAESFLSSSAQDPQTSIDAGYGTRAGTVHSHKSDYLEDEQEKFDRLQMELLMENPDSAAFYNAKMRTQRRKIYESAMSQPQPHMGSNVRQPGTPTRVVKSQPPNMLQVQY